MRSKFLRWIALFTTLAAQATELELRNENNARLNINISGLEEPTKIRIKDKNRRLENTYIFYPGKSLEITLPSSDYTIEPLEEKLILKPENLRLDIQDVYVKNGVVFSQNPLTLKIEPRFVEILGQIFADKSIIATAKALDVRRQIERGGHVVWDVSNQLEIEDGKIKGKLKEEGLYKIDILWLATPGSSSNLWQAAVDISPDQFYFNKNRNNYLSLTVTPKSNSALVKLENSYLIRKPAHGYQNIEKLIYKPTIKDDFGRGLVRVPLGEYLAECIKGDVIYRKKVTIGPYNDLGPYGMRGVEITFDESDKTDFSIIRTAGTFSATQIFQREVKLPYDDSYEEKTIPVIINEKHYSIKIQIRRMDDAIRMDVLLNDENFNILNLYNLKTPFDETEKIDSKLVEQSQNSTVCSLGGFDYTLEKSLIFDKFKIDVNAFLDFSYDNHRHIVLDDAKIFYKIYQTGEKINLLDFFR